ncbi:hypothetical protein MLD38_024064 [Melastoma candidum]|uniref:Uncharacterized protein n=1 Tax=Melastoma candidum TaxID=119954 RepID=A0ACB9NRI3_9MYRT|nr:hypothetical protein MLD38_024064 [Melastoma candidum]
MARILRMPVVATMILAIMILPGAPYGTRVQGQACQGDISALTAQCGPNVYKGSPQTAPSQGCCGVVKRTDVQCLREPDQVWVQMRKHLRGNTPWPARKRSLPLLTARVLTGPIIKIVGASMYYSLCFPQLRQHTLAMLVPSAIAE